MQYIFLKRSTSHLIYSKANFTRQKDREGIEYRYDSLGVRRMGRTVEEEVDERANMQAREDASLRLSQHQLFQKKKSYESREGPPFIEFPSQEALASLRRT